MGYKFSVLLVFVVLISMMTSKMLISDQLYFNTLAGTLGRSQIEAILSQNRKWEWTWYAFIPIIYFAKCSLIALCLSLSIFYATENEFEFKKMFQTAVKAEFVFLIPPVVKLVWFRFFQHTYTLQDLQYFYPLSALNMFDPKSLEPWLIYPLQVLNIFEVIYWIVLAYLLTKELPELDMNRSMTVVMASYGTGLVIWVAFVMFLTLTYT
ncbi:hypothetical protein [Dyadobacter sp. 3J3]|uniref:hypothetical protein n=1 Tax=Dyadobacter sp. 3J3 TaxID=2606600 RepID=UPI00135B7FC6|nr:hypothetical protein [Dyadobacter sp. 3J3]